MLSPIYPAAGSQLYFARACRNGAAVIGTPPAASVCFVPRPIIHLAFRVLERTSDMM